MSTRVVVEWTRNSLRAAVADGGGDRLRLRGVHARPLHPDEEVVPVLKSLAESAGFARAEVIGVIPREQVLARVVRFPSTRVEELGPMVDLYAKGQLPYAQAVTDFYVLSQEEGFSTVVVVACQREVVDRHLATLRDAGLSPVALTVSSWGVLGWYRQALVMDPSREPVLIVNVDDTRTDFAVIAGGRLLSSRSIGQGTVDWGATTDATELLIAETERTRTAGQKDVPGTEVRSIVLTGIGDSARWSGLLHDRLGLPVDAVEPPPGPAGPSVSAVAISGLADADLAGLLNLGSPELRIDLRNRRQFRELSTLGVLVAAVLAFGAGVLALQGYREERRAAMADRVVADVEPKARGIREKIRLTDTADAILNHRRQLAAALASVLRSTPQTVTLETLTFDRAKSEMVVRGSAGSTQDILSYVKSLEPLDEVAAVELKHSTRRAGAAGDRADFELLVRLQPAAAAKPDDGHGATGG